MNRPVREACPLGGRSSQARPPGRITWRLAGPARLTDASPALACARGPDLRALLDQARQNVVDEGVETALLHLATHCWFEGGVEGYDRGQRDARSELGD